MPWLDRIGPLRTSSVVRSVTSVTACGRACPPHAKRAHRLGGNFLIAPDHHDGAMPVPGRGLHRAAAGVQAIGWLNWASTSCSIC
jgi:hypothetical protein